MMNEEIFWWEPAYEFFGPFYYKGDLSEKGYRKPGSLSNQERTKKEIEFILRFLNPKPGDSFLDMPCGYGRHSLGLAALGFDVTGLDLNGYFIEECKKKAIEMKLAHASFIKGNMLTPELKDCSFDNAINVFTSFGFFNDDEDNKRVLENFYRILKPGGKLLLHFDFNATRIINLKYFKGDEYKFRKCFFDSSTYELYVQEHYNEAAKRLEGSWKLRNGVETIKEYSIRIYPNDEFAALLSSVGFKDIQFKDPDSAAFSEKSKETIIIATK